MKTMFCKNCGKPLEDGAKFCAECGTKFEPEEKTGEDVADKAVAVASEAAEQAKEKAKSFVNKAKELFKKFKSLSTKQKLIRIFVFVLILILLGGVTGGDGPAKVKHNSSTDCYYFDIKYDDFCERIADDISAVMGISESQIKEYCKAITPYDDCCTFCGEDVLEYEIVIEKNIVAVLKINVYVEPKTNKVVWAKVFKAKGSSTTEKFATLANGVSKALCGKELTSLESYVSDIAESFDRNTTYIQYKDYELKLDETKNLTGELTGSIARSLEIYCKDACSE